MTEYMVWSTIPSSGRNVWDLVGVFKAETKDAAFRAAAKKRGTAGVYFAVEGASFGLALETEPDVTELGREQSPYEMAQEREAIELERARLRLERERLTLNAGNADADPDAS